MKRDTKVLKVFRGVAIAALGLSLLLVGLLALTGGLRLRSPIGAMQTEIDRFELVDDETIVERTTIEDAICFLQCAEWRVGIVVERESTQTIEAECIALAARVESWSGTEVEWIPSEYRACLFSVVAPVFGRGAWLATASISRADNGDEPQMITWQLDISQP